MDVCYERCVLSGRGLCDELIICPEESYRMWCVFVCDLETSRIGAPYIYEISNLRVNDVDYNVIESLLFEIMILWIRTRLIHCACMFNP